MPESESERLLAAFRSLSQSHEGIRPDLDELEARINARRHRVRVAVAGSCAVVLVVVIALAVTLVPRSGQNLRVATQPTPGGTFAPNSPFCTVAHAIKKENATPMKAGTSAQFANARRLDQLQRLAAAAPSWLRPAIDPMSSTPHTVTGPAPTTPTTLVDPSTFAPVDQALSGCGLSLAIFGQTMQATVVPEPPTTLDPALVNFCGHQELPDAPEYVGLSMSQANALAQQRQERIRILVQDGHSIPNMENRVSNRIDVAVQSGHVVQACTEHP